MAEVIAKGDPAATVVTCPEWTLAKLVRHVARVHRWCAALVRTKSTERLDPRSLPIEAPADTADYPAWLSAGTAELEDALREVDPDTPVWAWGPDQHARFWPRRILHETLIHRVDAELTVGAPVAVDSRLAVDTIDEFFSNLAAPRFESRMAELRGGGEALALAATDVDVHWRIEIGPDGFGVRHAADDDEPAVSTLSGSAGELALVVYRRRPLGGPGEEAHGCTLTGDRSLWGRWLSVLSL